tara:strand:- start:2090 stop:3076 length:987 start_codon:yes stop_codon:yes gene_type:complete
MLSEFLKNNNGIDRTKFLNIDLGSSEKHLSKTKELETIYGFETFQTNNRKMASNLILASNWGLSKGEEWITYCHHDIYNLTKNFFSEYNYRLQYVPEFVGSVGVNVYHDHAEISKWNNLKPELMTIARSFVQKGDGWYRPRPTSRFNPKTVSMGEQIYSESVLWCLISHRSNLVKKYVSDKTKFDFFLSYDDIIMQFLSYDKPSFVFTDLCIAHDQSIKIKYNLTKSSPDDKNKEKVYGRIDHHKNWYDKWGFEFDFYKTIFGKNIYIKKGFNYTLRKSIPVLLTNLDTVARSTFLESRSTGKRYSNTINKFFDIDPKYEVLKDWKEE